MKFFMPVYAVALTLAVTSNMFEEAAGAAGDPCVAATLGCTETTCPAIAVQTATDVTKSSAAAAFTTTCTDSAKAYVKSLNIIVDDATTLSKVVVKSSNTDALASAGSALSPADDLCGNTFLDIGKTSPTADVKLSITCTAACAYKYKVEYACTNDVACLAATEAYACTADTCPTVENAANNAATSKTLEKPAAPTLAACTDGKYAYLKKLTIFPSAEMTTLTKASDIVVKVSKDGTATPVDVAKRDVYPACQNTYTNLGLDATKDVKVTIGCAASTKCNFRYKAEWACQAAAPSPTPTSGVASVCPVAAWGTALVAAIAGANIAAPL